MPLWRTVLLVREITERQDTHFLLWTQALPSSNTHGGEGKKNAWLLAPARHFAEGPGAIGLGLICAYLLLLLPVDFFSLAWLLRLLVPRLALARSLGAWLFRLLALPPLLADSERLMPPEDFELRDAIDLSPWRFVVQPARVRQTTA